MSNGSISQSSGIVTRRYKHGSIVYFENDKSEYIYILKSGRVVLTSRKVDSGEEVKEEIKGGEFFGVKSSLGKYPREETAQTVGETVLLVLPLPDFERLVLQNVNVVRKMLRIFSNQLRRLGRMQREVLGESESINPAEELFKIGEYYFKVGKAKPAQYAYKRYMEYYPDGKFSSEAMQRIKAIESGNMGSDYMSATEAPAAAPKKAAVQKDENLDLTDFSIDDDRAASKPAAPIDEFGIESGEVPSLTSELDDMFAEDSSKSNAQAPAGKKMDIAEMFYEAMNKFSQESFEESLSLYSAILNDGNYNNDQEKKFFERASFEIGRCYLKIGKFNEALTSFSDMIKKLPKSENVKNALFHVGITYEALRKNDKAIAYYSKVASMEPNDQISKLASKKLGQLQNTR